MHRRPLGTSGIHVTQLAMGTRALGGSAAQWGTVDDNESVAAIHLAMDRGVNIFDTAPTYGSGHAETILGRALAGRRHEVVIATKCGLVGSGRNGSLQPSLSGESIMRECEASLRRLETDCIDLYQCHAPDPATPMRQTMEALVTLLRQGKIRAIGLCDWSCEQVAAAAEFGPVHAVQMPLSLLHRRAAADLLPYCREHGIAVLACSPLASGLLTGKYSAQTPATGVRATDPDFVGNRFRRNLLLVEKVRAITAGYRRSPTELALNWAANFSGVTATIFGAKRPSQVLENTAACDWELEPADEQRVQSLLAEL